ncbi:MAG: threonine/serine dehydratase [Candidatus Krumholzibacteriia bacterium]
MRPIEPIRIDEIRAARQRIAGVALRTPLVHLELPERERPAVEIHLKLENLQPIGSFKLRGAANAMRSAGAAQLAAGVWTPSAGNMAQGVAWNARRMRVPCTVVVPENAPRTKLAAAERLGARIRRVPYEAWWQSILTHRHRGADGILIHPVSDPAVIAGNGTIGLEILDDLPDADAIVVPYGGGGLSAGIASAVRAVRPEVRVYACEVETAAPLAASLAAGSPREITHTPSFVDGIGGKSVLPEMWPLVSRLLAGSLVVSLAEVCEAIRLLSERCRVIAEGAGAAPVAAALCGRAGTGKVVCVVSGGNIDSSTLVAILAGGPPPAPREC